MKSLYYSLIVFISVCNSIHIFPQQLPEEVSKVLIRFNEPMSRDGIFDATNYKVIDESGKELKIFRIGVVEGDTAVVLFTESHSRGKVYKVIVSNLKDKSGNLISQDKNFASYQKAE